MHLCTGSRVDTKLSKLLRELEHGFVPRAPESHTHLSNTHSDHRNLCFRQRVSS